MNLLTLLLCSLLLAGNEEPADLVVENAKVWSARQTEPATFLAVRGGRFIHVGEPKADLIGPNTERVDAGGRVVIPGLIDSHIHMLGGGLLMGQLELRDAKDMRDFLRRVREYGDTLPDGAWVLGGRWSTESWDDPTPPRKDWLDAVSGDHPLFLSRMDGHSGVANSAALKLAGITREGPTDPPGGVIDRDPENGEPTGILRDAAMELVRKHIPPPTLEEKVAALRKAAEAATKVGITAVGDICDLDDIPAYREFAKENRNVRFYLYITAEDWEAAGREAGTLDYPMVKLRGFKAYMDGSLGSRTAYMREPYLGNDPSHPDWRGVLMEGVENGQLLKNLRYAKKSKMQPIVHAIGDEANHLLLDQLEEVFGEKFSWILARSEHAQHLLPEDIARIGKMGVVASMQPYHKADDGRYAESYIGPERAKSSYAFRSLYDAYPRFHLVAFGSDWPVVTNNPFLGIEAAVTGRTLDGKVWHPEQNISVEEALTCYTDNAAFALRELLEIGRIKPGFRADFVILDRSPFDAGVEWGAIKPVAVYVKGRRVD